MDLKRRQIEKKLMLRKCVSCGIVRDPSFKCPDCSSEQAHFEVIDLECNLLNKKTN